ncbi:U6 snRNA phosphodiesterase 1 [Hyperolius riggenbachi]|uniref:U6 snRNA phosphodiesterase 1 n=1 Tax=Hyperolius riggenbachi TaxID=752182 RepID=UPI0035A29865
MFPDPDGAQHTDDTTRHGGRMRSFPHQRGNWATYVYVPLQPQEEFLEMLDAVLEAARRKGLRMTKMEKFHISQSQTVILRHHWIDLFVQSLREGLSAMPRFLCVADRVKVYTNQEKTRTFLGLAVTVGHQQLLEVVSQVDKSLQEFNLETFFQNPSFHVSLAWCVGDCAGLIQGATLTQLQNVVDEFEDSEILTRFYAEEICCKSGNKTFTIPLR